MNEFVTILLFMLVIFFSNGVQTITGFAGALLAMPFGILLVGMNCARATVNILGLFTSLVIVLQYWKFIHYRELIKILAVMSIGTLLGFGILKITTSRYILVGYGCLIILVTLFRMLVKKEWTLPAYVSIPLLLMAGIIHGMFNSGGVFLVIYATSVLREKNEFRATLSMIWVVLNIFLVINHASNGYIDGYATKLILFSLPASIGAIALGNVICKHINKEQFMKVTYVLLLLSGIVLLK